MGIIMGISGKKKSKKNYMSIMHGFSKVAADLREVVAEEKENVENLNEEKRIIDFKN